MRVAHHFPGVPPPDPGRDAVLQEAAFVRELFPGPDRFHGAGRALRGRLPLVLQARPTRRRLLEVEAEVDLHHLFADRLEWVRAFAGATRPLVVSLTTDAGNDLPHARALPRLAAVIACDPEQRDRLAARGFRDLYVVPTPVDTTAVPREPAPPHPPWSLVAGSAPWTRRQFATKGVDLLLGAARRRADLTLTFLWRGVLEEPMGRRERRAGLGERLRVVHERAQVGRLLAASHAAVVLAARPRLVKAYPHSLLEALAASRPILASACLPIASWAEGAGCGVAVRELTPTALDRALEELADRYGELQQGAAALDLTDRSPARYREAVAAIYARACEARP